MGDEKKDNEVLERLRKIEEKIDLVEAESRSDFKNLHDVIESNRKQSEVTLSALGQKIEKLDKDSKVTGEDQLFFGLLISLTILFLTLPRNDLITLLSTLNKPYANYYANLIQFSGLGFFVISGVARYLAIMSSKIKTGESFRYFSLEFLIIGFDFIPFVFALNLVGLSNNVLIFSITFTILSLLSGLMVIIEKRVLVFYESRRLIPLKSKLLASRIFLLVSLFLNFVFIIEYVSVVFIHFRLSSDILALLSLGIVLLIFLLIFNRNKKWQNLKTS